MSTLEKKSGPYPHEEYKSPDPSELPFPPAKWLKKINRVCNFLKNTVENKK
tara:strand:+ start:1046 stop:1198 length:153 start_codon:yes stop_codon:yes gene_type:complete